MHFSILAGNAAVIKYEEKPPKPAFQNGSSAPLYLKPLVPRGHAHFLKTPPKGMGPPSEEKRKTGLFKSLSHRRLKMLTGSWYFYLQKV